MSSVITFFELHISCSSGSKFSQIVYFNVTIGYCSNHQMTLSQRFRQAPILSNNNNTCNNNNNRCDNVYGAVIVALHCHCESSPGSSDECSTQRQVAANLWTKPISLSHRGSVSTQFRSPSKSPLIPSMHHVDACAPAKLIVCVCLCC